MLDRTTRRSLLLLGCLLLLGGCCGLPRTAPMREYDFAISHPSSVHVYKPPAHRTPVPDKVFIYLRWENLGGEHETPLSFSHYSKKKNAWGWLCHFLEPVVEVENESAPILGEPEVRLSGLSSRTICPGAFFPRILPDDRDFPTNEANLRRDVCIVVTPDRDQQGQEPQGRLKVRVSIRYSDPTRSSQGAPVAEFYIPIKLINEFRPGFFTPTTADRP